MNILYLSTVYCPAVGGAQNHLHAVIKKLSSEHNVSVISQFDDLSVNRWVLDTTLFAPLSPKRYTIDNINVQQVNLGLWERILYWPVILPYYFTQELSINILSELFLKNICKAVDVKKIDLIHCVKIGREFLPLAGLKLARKLKIPFIFTPCHHPKWQGNLYRTYLDICKKADGLIALTEVEKNTFIKIGVNQDKIYVINVCPLLQELKESSVIDFKRKYNIADKLILFLGIKFRYKGIELLSKAAPFVWKKYPDAKFLFAGPRTKFSRKYFKRWKNESRIIELPALNEEEKSAALKSCSLLCLISSQESFGGVFLEAWSMGKPVIGGKIPAISAVIDDGSDGYLAEFRPENIAGKIIAILDNPALAKQMGQKGYRKVEEKYNLKNMVSLTEQAYFSLCRKDKKTD